MPGTEKVLSKCSLVLLFSRSVLVLFFPFLLTIDWHSHTTGVGITISFQNHELKCPNLWPWLVSFRLTCSKALSFLVTSNPLPHAFIWHTYISTPCCISLFMQLRCAVLHYNFLQIPVTLLPVTGRNPNFGEPSHCICPCHPTRYIQGICSSALHDTGWLRVQGRWRWPSLGFRVLTYMGHLLPRLQKES